MKTRNPIFSIISKLNPFSSVRSFENLTSRDLVNNYSADNTCSYVSTKNGKTYFTKKNVNIEELADYPIFATSYAVIESKILNQDIFIKTKYKYEGRKLENSLIELGFDEKFQRRLFEILYKGAGVALCLIDQDRKIRAIPFFYLNEELVKVTYNRYGDKINKIQIKEDKVDNPQWLNFDVDNNDYFIIYNQKQGNTYLSNLTIASPYIRAQNALTARGIRFSNNNFTVKPIISPKIDKFITSDTTADLMIGGQQVKFQDFLANTWKNISKQIQQSIELDPIPILPFEVDIKNLSQSNSQNQTNLERQWYDEKIQISCYTNGSTVGRDNTANRSVTEQDRDNLEETTIVIMQQKIASVANEFLIPLLYPFNHKEFWYEFYSVETDETIRLRDQNVRALEMLSNPNFRDLLTSNNLLISPNKLSELISSAHGLETYSHDQIVSKSSLEIVKPIENIITEADNMNTSNPELIATQNELTAINNEIALLEQQTRAYDANGNYYQAKTKQEREALNKENAAKRLEELKLQKVKVTSKLDYLSNPANLVKVKKPRGRPKGSKNRNGSSAFQAIMNRSTDELRVDKIKLDEVYKKYHSTVNMSYSQLLDWSKKDISKQASLSRDPINNNLRLLGKNKDDWTDGDISLANNTIQFVSRMKGNARGNNIKIDGKDMGISARDVSLMNWAYNPNLSSRSIFAAQTNNLPIVRYDDIDTSKFKQTLKQALLSQYNDIAKNTIRIEKGSSQFQNYLSKSDLRIQLRKMANDIRLNYNENYNSNIEDINNDTESNIESIINLTYNGGVVKKFNQDGILKSYDYKGFDNTQAAQLQIQDKLSDEIIESLVNQNIQSWEANMLIRFFNTTYNSIAIDDGKEYMGAKARNTKTTRAWHFANSGYAWPVNSNPPDNTNPYYYLEQNCRCEKQYGTREQLSKYYTIYD
jgi:hypothetical protein